MNRISERKIILIYRDTRLDELIRRYNTREQVRFYLESRSQSFADYDEEDRDYDPEALAEEVIDSWLETPAGQQFNLFDRDQR